MKRKEREKEIRTLLGLDLGQVNALFAAVAEINELLGQYVMEHMGGQDDPDSWRVYKGVIFKGNPCSFFIRSEEMPESPVLVKKQELQKDGTFLFQLIIDVGLDPWVAYGNSQEELAALLRDTTEPKGGRLSIYPAINSRIQAAQGIISVLEPLYVVLQD